MPESWMEYLHRIEVFSDRGVEMCHQCEKLPGEVQMYGGIGGKKVPVYKFCGHCHGLWKKYAKLAVR